ncbi:MAG: DUF262 domain-containing protein [Acidobacteria bacterium]|nr:DUF262 domain-containing protein [Acidobacteriota bacterium]
MDTYEPADEQDKAEAKSCLTNIRAKLVSGRRTRSRERRGVQGGEERVFSCVCSRVQNHNLADYRYLLSEAGLIEGQPKQPYCGNRLLGRAYAYFQEKISSDVADLLKLMERINQLMFVQITVGSQADAFTLFESLNNRGVPLSAMDIIKNKMLAQMEKKHAVDIDESFERWQGLIEAIPDANDQERFLRQFYNTFKHRKEIKVDKVTRATRSLIIRVYETLINRDAALLFEELTMSATTYGKLPCYARSSN